MHGLPQNFDASFLVGKTLEMVCFNATQLYFHFSGHATITVEGAFSYQDWKGDWYMLTYGMGNNTIPDMAEIDQALGPGIFRIFDDAMRSNISRHH